jgi:acyl-CoA thioesterase-1
MFPLDTSLWRLACRVPVRLELRSFVAALLVVLTGVAAGACGGSSSGNATAQPGSPAAAPEDPAAPPARPKIVALGDSLTAGLGLVESESYPVLLQRKIDAEGYEFEVVNAGVSGDTTAGGLRRLDWALEGDVRILIVALGGNDGLRGLSVADMKRNLSAIIERARERGVTVILAGMEAPPNYGQEYATAFRQAFRDVALTHRVLYIPFLLQGVAGHAELNQSDGIHPNVRGAAKVADTVWAVLRPMLDQMTSTS